MKRPRLPVRRSSLKADAVAGLVLGVESVPDGLASGLLAAINPVSGLYAYMVGTVAGAFGTSTALMAIQATGAMSVLIADVPAVHTAADPQRAVFTLAVLTGVVMAVAGVLRLGTALRFVSNAVMVGFINAVGVNIVLGQLSSFTGYAASGANRVTRALNTLVHPGRLDWPSIAIGAATIALIVLLERTPLGALGMVVAIAITSAAVQVFHLDSVAILRDIAEVPRSLPRPVAPQLKLVPALLVPALSLAFVGLVQGAGVAAAFPNADGRDADASRDFIGQGAANVASGLLQGMPVGGSMSASSIISSAGAKSRQALVIAGLVMAAVILLFGAAVGYIAMPALAGLLMVIGYRTVKPAVIETVTRSGLVSAVVLWVTFTLTMLIPLQYAVLVGVGLSVVLFVVHQSNQVRIVERRYDDDGTVREVPPPVEVASSSVLVLQPYGGLFFASAPVFEAALPAVAPSSTNAVVILRLRGRSDLGTTFMEMLRRYAEQLTAVGSKLVLVSADERLMAEFEITKVTEAVGEENIYPADERVGVTLRRARADALKWVDERRGSS